MARHGPAKRNYSSVWSPRQQKSPKGGDLNGGNFGNKACGEPKNRALKEPQRGLFGGEHSAKSKLSIKGKLSIRGKTSCRSKLSIRGITSDRDKTSS